MCLSAIYLTSPSYHGCLRALSPLRRMERDQSLPDHQPTHEFSPAHSGAERLNRRRTLSRLRRLARSTRGRIGAALLAVVGTGAAAKEAEAATIMMPGEIVPREEVAEQPEYALGLTNDEYYYTIGNVDGTADATMTWFGVKSPAFTLEQYVEVGSDVPNSVMAPDQLDDGNRSEFFLTEAELPELNSLRYALDSRYPDGSPANLFRFLQNAEVRAGFGPLTGNPQNIDEATAMTNGPVMQAFYASDVELDDAWIFRSVHEPANTPEPSTLGLAGAALAVGLASRRRLQELVQTQH
jgi:PEP-CTERM motif